MKKRLPIILSALALSMTFGCHASDPELDTDISIDGLFNSSPVSAASKFDTSEVFPAINLLTGTKDAYTFEDASFADYFYNGDYGSASQYVFTTGTDDNKGKMLAVVLDEDEYNKKHTDNTTYVYSSPTVSFTNKLDRPVHLYFETYGTKQIGFWLESGSTHKVFGQLGNSAWHSVSMDNASVFNGSMNTLRLQYATRPSDCSEVQYFDNIAVFPYYKITYNAEYPDGTSGTDTVKYFFDASSLSVADDGTVTGLSSAYTVEDVTAECIGYTISGWSTEKNATEVMTEIDLNGSDIELYPVWKEADSIKIPEKNFVPGINIFTGNTNAFTFDAPGSLKYFKSVQDTELFTLDLTDDPSSSGRGKMLRITHDTEKHIAKYGDAATYTYFTLQTDLEKQIQRPGALVYDVYGKGTVGFWLSSGSNFVGLGLLPSSYAWTHVAKSNFSVYNGTMSGVYIQYGINASTCGAEQYFDNVAFIPHYKATYVINYPDGATAEPKEIFFLGDINTITTSTDGKLNIPASYTPEDIGISFPGYDLAGWTTEENGDTAMSEIPLANEDITIYPVWEKKAEAFPVALTVYLDTEKKVSSSYEMYAGDAFTLPTYADLAEYTPDGLIPTGFELDGKLYAPGKTLYLPEVSVLTAQAKYGEPDHPEYGKLVFLENFESIKNGTYICNPDTSETQSIPISYINPDWSTNASHFNIGRADTASYIYVTDDGTGNSVLKTQKLDASQTWPQFGVYNTSTTPVEGYYTICIDYYFPSSELPYISGMALRTFTTTSKFDGVFATMSKVRPDTWEHLSMSTTIEAGSAAEALYKYQIYISSKSTSSDAYFFVDNISLYVRDKSLIIDLGDENTKKLFFANGDEITFPYAYEVYGSIPEGYTLSGYKHGNVVYKPGESLTVTDEMDGITLEAVYEKIKYTLLFDAADGYGSPHSIILTDGESAVLPNDGVYHKGAKLIGWKKQGSDKVYGLGEKFTFVRADESANLDGTDRLVFTAVYDGEASSDVKFTYNYALSDGMFENASADELSFIKLAYGAGIIPASDTFDADASVSLSQLIAVAERLHYRSQGIASDFLTEDDRLSDMVTKGICKNYTDTSVNATFTDVSLVLANALPNSYYGEIAFDVTVKGLAYGDEGYTEALKLTRSGILPESTDFSADITYGELVKAIAKTVQPSIRESENKRTFHVLGDSLTAKTGTIGWPTKLDKFLDGNLAIVNNGIGGINTGIYFSVYDPTGANALYTASLKSMKKGDYVVIALGTNDSTLWGWGDMKYETSRDNYLRYISEIRAQGGIPIMVCPVGRNTTDENGVLIESDPLIIECMNDVNTLYGVDAAIINFKEISLDRLGAMSAEERASFYAPGDNVHYSASGAELVAKWFGELVSASTDPELSGLKPHFNEVSFDFDSEENIYSFSSPETALVTSVRTAAPSGIRFKASIDEAARDIKDDTVEYGFIVARSDILGDNELTHDTSVTYVTGTAYSNVSGTDIIYGVNGENGDITFTGVLTGIPENKAALTSKLTVRSYIKVGCSYFYGEAHEDSIYEASKRLTDTDSEYVKNIIEICEK